MNRGKAPITVREKFVVMYQRREKKRDQYLIIFLFESAHREKGRKGVNMRGYESKAVNFFATSQYWNQRTKEPIFFLLFWFLGSIWYLQNICSLFRPICRSQTGKKTQPTEQCDDIDFDFSDSFVLRYRMKHRISTVELSTNEKVTSN